MKKICLLLLAILSVTIMLAQPPANDNVCDATALTLDADCSTTLPYDNTLATAQQGEKSGECYGDGTVEQSVWFTFVAPSTGAVSITTDFANSGMQDNQLAVFELEGTDCTVLPNYIEVACNEDLLPAAVNTEFNAGTPAFPVTAGNTYYIQVDGFTGDDGDPATNDTDEGAFCIMVSTVTPPDNDYCTSADPYGGFGANCTKMFDGTTIGATAGNDIDVFSCDGSDFNATVYYTLTAGVAEVEFNLLSGENINVSLLTNPDLAACNGSAVEVTGNCFTDIDTSTEADPSEANVLFTNLTPMTPYLMAIWTDEGEETDFSFCLTRAPAYECGDDICYALAESYTDCPVDCPCISSVDLYSYITGDDTTTPEGVCPEIVGGVTDAANPGLYIPFTITTNDNDLSESLVSSTVGSLFSSSIPPSALLNSEATNFLTYLFLTEAELAAGGNVTITFGSDDGACDASVTFAISDLIRPQTSECGGCDLNILPDYATASCDGTSVPLTLAVENGTGPNVWISQDGNTVYDAGVDLLVALDGSTSITFPANDLTLTVYDQASPNCATRVTFTTGDYICPPGAADTPCFVESGPALACRLDPEAVGMPFCDGSNVGVTIDVGRATGTVDFSPAGIVSVADDGSYVATLDPANCQAIDFTVSDESTCDQTPIVTINSPASVAGGITVSTNTDEWGVQIADTLGICGTNGSVVGTLAVLDDGDTEGGQLTDFCEPTPPVIPDASVCADIAGKIALIDRGQCTFTSKVQNAQACGAIGVIICNCQPGPGWCSADADELIGMSGSDAGNVVTIPAVFMLYSDCQQLKMAMNEGPVETCIGAPETIAGCSRDFTLNVCDQLPTDCGVPGCTDDTACNFNPDATEDDGSCQLPPAEPATECYETATLDNATCTWTVTGEQDPEPTTACYETATFDVTTCAWVIEGTQPVIDDGCDLTTDTFDEVTCMAVNTSTCPDNTNLNTTTCMCDDIIVPGCTDECASNYDPMANEDDGSCMLPAEPTTECYQTATFNTTTCVWDITGEQDAEPTGLACYETAAFDEATCAWIVSGEQDVEPADLACYETAAFDEATCAWVISGEQDPEPTTVCYETAAFDDATCAWVVTGDQPEQPTDLACYETVGAFDDATCAWQILGEQPTIDDGCDLTTDTFDDATCMAVNTSTCPENTTLDEVNCMCTTDVIEGCTDDCASNYDPLANSDDGSCILPEEPTTACYETASFNETTCAWEISGMQPEAPTTECYETADFDDASCSWIISGERDPEPTDLACYETTSFDDASCAWVTVGEQPATDDGCDLTTDTFDDATCLAVNTPNCDAGTSFDAANCACTSDPILGCTDDTACNYDPNATEEDNSCTFLPEEPTDLACYETATSNLATCAWDVTGEQPTVDDGCDVTDDSYDEATCEVINTSNCAAGTTYNAATCACDSDAMCDDPCAPNYEAAEACEAYSTDCNADCALGDVQVWDAASCACVTETVSVSGCTDSNANNYNAAANCDDDSCTYDPVEECTPPSAGDFNCDE